MLGTFANRFLNKNTGMRKQLGLLAGYLGLGQSFELPMQIAKLTLTRLALAYVGMLLVDATRNMTSS